MHHMCLAEKMEKARWLGSRQLWDLSSPSLPSEKQKAPPGAVARQEEARNTYPPPGRGHRLEELHLNYGADPQGLLSWPTAVQGHLLIKLWG